MLGTLLHILSPSIFMKPFPTICAVQATSFTKTPCLSPGTLQSTQPSPQPTPQHAEPIAKDALDNELQSLVIYILKCDILIAEDWNTHAGLTSEYTYHTIRKSGPRGRRGNEDRLLALADLRRLIVTKTRLQHTR